LASGSLADPLCSLPKRGTSLPGRAGTSRLLPTNPERLSCRAAMQVKAILLGPGDYVANPRSLPGRAHQMAVASTSAISRLTSLTFSVPTRSSHAVSRTSRHAVRFADALDANGSIWSPNIERDEECSPSHGSRLSGSRREWSKVLRLGLRHSSRFHLPYLQPIGVQQLYLVF
jgi:hypothetical protein